jgi:hypothetical protein
MLRHFVLFLCCNKDNFFSASFITTLQSKLEFKLRLQEFIELVREEQMMEAVTYARKYLASWGSTNMKELQQAMATLAFKSNTDCASYKVGSWVVASIVHL